MGVVTDAVGSQAGSLAVLTLFALYLLACVPMIRSENRQPCISTITARS